MAVTRTVEHFTTQPPVVSYTAPAPKKLRGMALKAELVEAGLPASVDVAACVLVSRSGDNVTRADGVRVSLLDDEKKDRTDVISAVLKAHKGEKHDKESDVPDLLVNGR